jgi:hypothetical protein
VARRYQTSHAGAVHTYRTEYRSGMLRIKPISMMALNNASTAIRVRERVR